jgi:replication-associated recombination protein RarA
MTSNKKVKSQFIFQDGSDIYKKINKKYNQHDQGFVIFGPPGIGKTTFIHNQKGNTNNWIDQDFLFSKLGVKWNQNAKNKYDFKLN